MIHQECLNLQNLCLLCTTMWHVTSVENIQLWEQDSSATFAQILICAIHVSTLVITKSLISLQLTQNQSTIESLIHSM